MSVSCTYRPKGGLFQIPTYLIFHDRMLIRLEFLYRVIVSIDIYIWIRSLMDSLLSLDGIPVYFRG